jgi:sugar O-acyltransferase (sialic acid O-acetyltransferase NeuD family)
MKKKVVLVGYSGHALVAAETLQMAGYEIIGYLEKEVVKKNLIDIPYLGFEQNIADLDKIKGSMVFPAIGDNAIREKVILLLQKAGFKMPSAVGSKANISNSVSIGEGTLICQGALINPFAIIGNGVIINTGAIIEHECVINDFAHIAPGAVLAGNVKVGKGSFIGANAVIKQGVIIGDYVTIGAGSVVLKNIENNTTFAGNPAKLIIK